MRMTNLLLGDFTLQTDAHELKSRLQWGQPAFTIIDVRERQTYNQGHISGAIPLPVNELVKRATVSLAKDRDIYIYGDSDEQSASAAKTLRDAGFARVSELTGGFSAWKAAGGSTEEI
ncbi:rhodanese-like domain-containing protein [Brasilonema bromeliae]|uniref:Rhodanese-like domain-containing protein n=1 Tax=Brasilonema bromeliae SPC951 TaxID=385972 RepID=A0ABX1P6Z5_9CYAN|nr:rhodanese-like domain-containing protein [Brasilonema bromeliae SPC951]